MKLKIGDKVLLKNAAKEKQWSEKLASKWKGPYYIHKEIGKEAYKLRTLNEKVLKHLIMLNISRNIMIQRIII